MKQHYFTVLDTYELHLYVGNDGVIDGHHACQ
jgi:hypothetical protein